MKTVTEILKGMQSNQKINYDKVLKQVIENWQQEQLRPTVLLHSCCAPCSTSSLEYLVTYADMTVYFANSNIHPRTEYL
uniref:epoxyqueuosine reductase QueH n=1 Tax=Vagococcus salmoninarum TaxID=2739 RepID=UPI0028D4E9FD